MKVINPFKDVDLESAFEDARLINRTGAMMIRKSRIKLKNR